MNTISYDEQTHITRTIIKAAVMMLEFGAESKLIEQTSQRMGVALGVDSVEMSLIPSAIVLTTLTHNQSVTTTRMAHHKPINMSIVFDVQRLCIELEKKKFDVQTVMERLKNIQPNYYNRFGGFNGGHLMCIFCVFTRCRLGCFCDYFFSFKWSDVCTTRTGKT
jgi:uncharacterized membrane protein YjjP (DUF1212 family)